MEVMTLTIPPARHSILVFSEECATNFLEGLDTLLKATRGIKCLVLFCMVTFNFPLDGPLFARSLAVGMRLPNENLLVSGGELFFLEDGDDRRWKTGERDLAEVDEEEDLGSSSTFAAAVVLRDPLGGLGLQGNVSVVMRENLEDAILAQVPSLCAEA